MFFLLLSILSSTGIFVIFKLIQQRKIDTFQVIITNYVIATGIGFLLHFKTISSFTIKSKDWILFTCIIGFLFILMFFVLGWSSEKAGITKTTVSAKLSVILPIMFSLFIDSSDSLSILKLSGIIIALLAVFLTVYKKRNEPGNHKAILLLIVLFIGMGIVDTLVKFSHHNLVGNNSLALFTAILFFISTLSGFIVYFVSGRKASSLLNKQSLIYGTMLGVVNFGAIYFFMEALSSSIDSTVVFGINNIGIVLLCVLTGIFMFKEPVSLLNKFGIFLSLTAIFVLSYS